MYSKNQLQTYLLILIENNNDLEDLNCLRQF